MFNHHGRTRPSARSVNSATEEELAQKKLEDDVTDMFDALRCGIVPELNGLDNTRSSLLEYEEDDNSEEVPEDGLRLDFLVAGEPRIVYFETSKLGMTFNNDMPLVVTRVALGSAAKALGVERGWRLVAIAGEDLQGQSWEDALRMLKAGAAALPSEAVDRMPSIKEDAAPSESSCSQSDRSSLHYKSTKKFPDDLQSSTSTPSTTVTSLTDGTFESASIDGARSIVPVSAADSVEGATPQPVMIGAPGGKGKGKLSI